MPENMNAHKHDESSDSDKLDPRIENIINNFFESLEMDEEDPLVDQIKLGELMSNIDFKNRWIYKGSMTVPPCLQYVYWNVIQQIYPIRPEMLLKFKTKIQ